MTILIESIHLYAYKYDNSRIQIAGRRANLSDHPEQALENIGQDHLAAAVDLRDIVYGWVLLVVSYLVRVRRLMP